MYIITRKPYFIENDFYKKYSVNKIKDQKKTKIIPHQSFPTTSTFHPNVLLVPQIREQFSKIPANTKIYNLRDNRSLEKKQFSKVSGKITNDIRIKGFLKNEKRNKHKHSDMLTYIYFTYNYQIIFRTSCNKFILKNVS